MSRVPICSIVISSQIPTDEIESLETSLRMAEVEIQKSTSRVIGADDMVFVATVLGGLAAAASLIDYGIKEVSEMIVR